MLVTKLLAADEWDVLSTIRLRALRDSPFAFLAEYQKEELFDPAKWRAEFERGNWYVGGWEIDIDKDPMGMLGVTWEPATPRDQCFLEYLWVDRENRGRGVASEMINQVLERLQRSGIRTVFLWILDGNDAALQLYKKIGFVSCDVRQPLENRPDVSEELMRLSLG